MLRLTSLLLLLSFSALKAQITIDRYDIIASGQKLIIALDDNKQKFANSGPNQVWDYSKLKADGLDSIHFGLNYWYKGYSNFPNANFASIYYTDSQSISFMHLNDTSFGFEGFYNYTSSSEDIAQSQSSLIRFPSTYKSKFNESHVFQGGVLRIKLDPDTAGPMPFIDSIRIDQTRLIYSNIDGWGTLKIPIGNFPTLKQTTMDVIAQTYMIKSLGSWKLAPNNILQRLKFPVPNYDTSYSVNFWTNNSQYGYPILVYYYSPKDTVIDAMQWVFQKSKSSSIKSYNTRNLTFFPNPANNSIQVSGDLENVLLEIWDIQGRQLSSYNNLESSIDIENLDVGIYILKFLDKNTGENLSSQTMIKS